MVNIGIEHTTIKVTGTPLKELSISAFMVRVTIMVMCSITICTISQVLISLVNYIEHEVYFCQAFLLTIFFKKWKNNESYNFSFNV